MGLPSIMDGIALNGDLHRVRASSILFENVIITSFRSGRNAQRIESEVKRKSI